MDLELRLGAFGRHTRQNQDSAPKMLPRRPGRETGKQHGLASPRTPFFELLLRDLQCQTSRPEPIKKGEKVLQLRASICTSHWLRDGPWVAFGRVWASHPAKPGLHRKCFQKPGRETGKQHGLASPRTPFFDLLVCDLQCQRSRPEPMEKERVLQLRPWICASHWLRDPPWVAFGRVWASRPAKLRLDPLKRRFCSLRKGLQLALRECLSCDANHGLEFALRERLS